ncbi:MAG: ATP-dependent helicase [Lachnospiraceae bacterium]|nr:ATP-dependent helicase [Lachnospiraceae bacterium]
MRVDSYQREAICHNTGPALVIAGPGSGKTTVITERISHLIKTYSVKPENILVLTFSKAAAAEMKARFLKLANQKSSKVTFGTFHAIFLNILKDYYREQIPAIITHKTSVSLMNKALRNLSMNTISGEFIEELLSDLQRTKSKCNSMNSFESKHISKNEFMKVKTEYERLKAMAGFMDFDDILYKTKELMEKDQKELTKLQTRYSYILIDEFQDINPIQYDIMKKIIGDRNHLFAVGDEDQSIYGFRGANPTIIDELKKDYPYLKTYFLPVNYRCGKEIVIKSSKLIAHNTKRTKKELVSFSESQNGHAFISVLSDYGEEYKKICNTILSIPKNEWSNTVILTRKNEISMKLVRLFRRNMIPYSVEKEAKNIYETEVAKDITAYFKLTKERIERDSFLRVMNKPQRFLRADIVPFDIFEFDEVFVKADRDEREALRNLQKQIEFISKLDPFSAIQYIKKGIGYEDYLRRMTSNHSMIKTGMPDFVDCLAEIHSDSKEFSSITQWLEETEDMNHVLQEKNDGVRIMTMHHSKGLEFKHVIIPDLNEGNIPLNQLHTKEETEEERRLLYVAMTRAIDTLHLYSVEIKEAERIVPSRFLKELC